MRSTPAPQDQTSLSEISMSYASIIATLNNDNLYNATLLLAKSLGRIAEAEMVADALNQYYAACVERGINMSKIDAELE